MDKKLEYLHQPRTQEMKKDTSILSKAEQGNFRSCSTILKVSVDVVFHDIGGGNPMIRHRIAT